MTKSKRSASIMRKTTLLCDGGREHDPSGQVETFERASRVNKNPRVNK